MARAEGWLASSVQEWVETTAEEAWQDLGQASNTIECRSKLSQIALLEEWVQIVQNPSAYLKPESDNAEAIHDQVG